MNKSVEYGAGFHQIATLRWAKILRVHESAQQLTVNVRSSRTSFLSMCQLMEIAQACDSFAIASHVFVVCNHWLVCAWCRDILRSSGNKFLLIIMVLGVG